MAAIVCLPRQFHIAIVENVDERHLATASWLFPLYLLLMSLFALPIAAAGLTLLPRGANSDFYVLTVPMSQGQHGLALLAFIGGLSSATAMVVVEAIALSTMVCNDLVMPVAAAHPLAEARRPRRPDARCFSSSAAPASSPSCCSATPTTGVTGEAGALAQIGLVSFAVAAQLAPPIVGGLFWKNATRLGAPGRRRPRLPHLGLYDAGAAARAQRRRCPRRSSTDPGRSRVLRPEALFGLSGWDPLAHAFFWSMIANIGGYVLVSLFSRQDMIERIQAIAFVDVFRRPPGEAEIWRRSARDRRSLCAAAALHRAGARRPRLPRLCRRARRGDRRPPGGRRRADRLRRAPAGRQRRRGLGARHGRLDRQGRAAALRRGRWRSSRRPSR